MPRRRAARSSPRRRRPRRARCAPGCCASTTRPAGTTSRARSSSAAAATSRARASPTSATGRTSTSGSSRSTAGSAASTGTTTSSTRVWPASHVAMIEQRGMLSSFPALLQAGDDGIADWYEVRAEGSERVAGHEANVLAIRARDGLRYGYRLWADRASGLLLRAEVVGERGDVLETSAFSDVVIGIRPQPESVLNDDAQARGISRRSAGAHADPPRGRRLDDAPARARLSPGELRQPADRGAGRRRRRARRRRAVIQSIYSDGLTYVSVFIEPYRAERHAKPMFASIGRDVDPVAAPRRLVGDDHRRHAAGDAQNIRRSARAKKALGFRSCARPLSPLRQTRHLVVLTELTPCRSSCFRPARPRVASRTPRSRCRSACSPPSRRRRSPPRASPTSPSWSRRSGPAVVNIRTTERGRTARGGSGNEQDDEMAELFRRFFGVSRPAEPAQPAHAAAARRRAAAARRRLRASSSTPTATS